MILIVILMEQKVSHIQRRVVGWTRRGAAPGKFPGFSYTQGKYLHC